MRPWLPINMSPFSECGALPFLAGGDYECVNRFHDSGTLKSGTCEAAELLNKPRPPGPPPQLQVAAGRAVLIAVTLTLT